MASARTRAALGTRADLGADCASCFGLCTVYDCFGAGQKVSRHTFGGRSWREDPETAAAMFAAFGVVRRLHELLWHLDQAITLTEGSSTGDADELVACFERVRARSEEGPEKLMALDVDATVLPPAFARPTHWRAA